MANIISDEEMQKLEAAHGGPSFISDHHMDALESQNQKPQESMGRQLTRATLDTVLPIGGAIGAGLLATPESGGLLTIPAGAAGYAGGKQLSRIAKHYILGDDIGAQDLPGLAKQTAGDLTDGAAMEVGGQLIGKIPGLAKEGLNSAKNVIAKKFGQNLEYTPIANKEAVLKAADQLGLNVPKGVLTDNPNYQKLESGLSQSGSLPAKQTREQYNQFYGGLDKAASKLSDLKTPESEFALGQSIQNDLSGNVNALKKPVSEMYNRVTPDLQKIQVNEKVVNRVFGDLKKDPIFMTKDGSEFLNEHKDIILNLPELASLKEVRSSLRDMVNQNSLPIEAKRIDKLAKALTSIRDNSIESLKLDLPKAAHEEIHALQNEIALADSAHASNIKDINSIKRVVGNKEIGSPTTFLNKLSEMKEGDLAQKAANLDVTSMRSLKEKFPSTFEKAKTAKVNDLIQSSTNPSSGFNETSFMKKYDSLDQEMKDLLFTPEIQGHIDALKTVKQAIPDRLGPSGTPEGLMTMDMFNPKRNVLDYGIKKALEIGSKPQEISVKEAVSSGPSKVTPLLQLLKGGSTSQPPAALPRAADKQTETAAAPIKGEKKWMNDGAEKLKTHGLDDTTVEELMKSRTGQDILIKASDLKPGSPAMEKIINRIKAIKGGKNV